MTHNLQRIAVNEPVIDAADVANVLDCLHTGWISSAGTYIDEFEGAWSAYCGMPHGIAVSNGTVALQAAVEALQLPRGGEIIMPSFTIISCALAAIHAGLKPVFVDSDPATWCIDAEAADRAVTSRTVAVMPVHMYGHPADMDPILALAQTHGLAVIEDAAEAHGAEYKERRCGGLGDVSCFSFYANKIITTGEGGMVLAKDEAVADRLRKLRNLCFEPSRRFKHSELGHNFRLTNMQAAIGVGQVRRIDELVARKRQLADLYTTGLRGIHGLSLPVEKQWAKNVYWMYGIVLDANLNIGAAEFARSLSQRGIETRPFFLPMHEQPIIQKLGLAGDGQLPVSEWLGESGLYLPSGLNLSDNHIDRCIDAVRGALETHL